MLVIPFYTARTAANSEMYGKREFNRRTRYPSMNFDLKLRPSSVTIHMQILMLISDGKSDGFVLRHPSHLLDS